MLKALAFDVSETLQTSSDQNDGHGQPMVDPDGYIIPDAYSVLMGGLETARLLNQAQEKGIKLYLVTNNGDDLDKEVINRTLNFLKNYGVIISPENYLGPRPEDRGSKVPRLEWIAEQIADVDAETGARIINKSALKFFDDSRNNVEEAEHAGFTAIRVRTAENLISGIQNALAEHEADLVIQQEMEKVRLDKQAEVEVEENTEYQQLDMDDRQSYDLLNVEFRQYLSANSQTERHLLTDEGDKHISTEAYWNSLDRYDQLGWVKKFEHQATDVDSPKTEFFDTWKKLDIITKSHISEILEDQVKNTGLSIREFWNVLDESDHKQILSLVNAKISSILSNREAGPSHLEHEEEISDHEEEKSENVGKKSCIAF